MQMATLEQLNNMMQQMHKQSVSTLNSDPKDVLSLPIVQKVIMAYEDELKLNKSSKDCKCKCDEFIPTILEHLDKHNLRLQLIENRLDDLFSLLKNKESSEPVIDKNQTKLTSFPGFGQIPLSDHIMMGLSLQDTYLKSLEISEEPCLESQQSCLESQQSCLEKELHNLETQQHLLEEESHELDTQQNLLEEESRELEWHRLKEEAHCLDEEIHSLNEEFRTLKENLQQSYLEEELHCSDQENITLNIEEIEAETDDLEEEIDDAVEEESEDAVEEETEDPEDAVEEEIEDAVEEETEDAVEEETEDAVEEETEDAVVAEPVEDASDETDSTEEEVVTEEDEDEVTNVAKEEEQDEEEEGEEVFEIEIDDVTYFATDEENGILYEVDKDGDIGKKVGIIKDGEPIFS
jgi:hypothetical protein